MEENLLHNSHTLDKSYLTKFIGISNDTNKSDFSFKDQKLEHKFKFHSLDNNHYKSKLFCIFVLLAYIVSIITNLIINDYKYVRTSYLLTFGVLFEIICTIITYYSLKNFYFKCHFVLKLLRYFTILLIYLSIFLFPVNSISAMDQIRTFYFFIIYLSLFQIYYIDFNYYTLFGVPFLNLLSIIYIQYSKGYSTLYFFPEMSCNIIFYYFAFQIKKSETINSREVFYELTINQHITEYIKNLIDFMNNFVISIKNKEVIYINKFAYNYFIKKKDANDTYKKTISDISNNNINSFVQNFFDSLKLSTYLNNNELSYGKTLYEMISEISRMELDSKTECFTRIGFFSLEGTDSFYDVYMRKANNNKEAVIEISIYDVTEIKLAEKTITETKYKQKLLAKIAHEFKTPLITIISLIEKTIENTKNKKIFLQKLDHIKNFSNFSVILVNDLIFYVSDLLIRVNLKKINLTEIINFCFNIMKTFIECNENKVNKIETIMKIDNNIDELIINSDENALKQIILNFISNSVKFTYSGVIKLSAKFLKDEKSVEINVKDTGVGINHVDRKTIFQDKKINFNFEDDYNTKGSGLGLSICKALANSLGHKIGFKSEHTKGSKFFIKIKSDIEEKIELSELPNSNLIEKPVSINSNRDVIYRIENSNLVKEEIINELSENSEMALTPRYNFSTNKYEFLKDKEETQIENVQKIDESLSNNDPKKHETLKINHFYFTLNEISNESVSNIIVIDDNQLVRENTARMINSIIFNFKMNDYKILQGSDGVDLLNFVIKARSNNIKCIFTDENMIYLNGSDAVMIIRKLEQLDKVKSHHIISITAFDDIDTKNKIIKSGINQIISKPCTKTSIIDVFKKLSLI